MADKGRVLVVDDDPITRDLVCSALRGQGYQEVGVSRVAEALEAAHTFEPHLIVSDMVLPDGNGVDLAHTLRQTRSECDMPAFILMSAFSKNRLADQRALKEQAGAAAFLAKPFPMPAMLDLVAQQIALRGPGRPLDEARAPAKQTASPAPDPEVRKGAAPPTVGDPFADGVPPSLLVALADAWRRQWTGTLFVVRPGDPKDVEKRVMLEAGEIVWATTTLLDERLGRILLRLGWLRPEQYEPMIREAMRRRRYFGEVLVANGLLTLWQLQDALLHHIETIVLNTLAWPDGTYRITACSGKPETSQRVKATPIPRLVARACFDVLGPERIDARLALEGNRPIVRQSDVPPGALEQLTPTPEERGLLEALERPAPLDQLLGAHAGGPEAARPFLAALLLLGIAAPDDRSAEGGPRRPEAATGSGDARPASPVRAAPASAGGPAAAAPPPPARDPKPLEAEAAFQAGRRALERDELVAAAMALQEAVALAPDEGEYLAWQAWAQALLARAAFDDALDGVAEQMERAAGFTPSSQDVYQLIERVIRLRMASDPNDLA
jgi:CheY-like chemotaxis protein